MAIIKILIKNPDNVILHRVFSYIDYNQKINDMINSLDELDEMYHGKMTPSELKAYRDKIHRFCENLMADKFEGDRVKIVEHFEGIHGKIGIYQGQTKTIPEYSGNDLHYLVIVDDQEYWFHSTEICPV